MLLAKAPAFSRVTITDLGSIQEIDTDPPAIGDPGIIWSRCATNTDNPFALNQIRGIIHPDLGLIWIPEDAEVEIVEPPRYAGQPEDLIKQARPVKAPAGSKGVMKTADGWPTLIWESDLVFSPVQGWVAAMSQRERAALLEGLPALVRVIRQHVGRLDATNPDA